MHLGLDLGTTNVKAVLTRDDGRIAGRGAAPVGLRHVAGGGVEQDIEEIWSAALFALRQAVGGCDAGEVRALGVSAQGGAMQVLDGEGRPVGRVISWLDGRGAPHAEALNRRLGRGWFAEHVGHRGAGLAVGQILRLRDESPGLLRLPHRVGFVGDVIVGRLCGRRAHDVTSLSLTLLLNPTFGAPDPQLMEMLDLSPEMLPDLLGAREAAGGLLPEAARAAGLPEGVPVSPAVHDQYSAALGCGAARAGDVMFGAGTAWVLLAVSERLEEPATAGAFVCPHPVPGLYGQILSLVNGGSALDWALDLLGLSGASSEELDDLLDAAPPGADGLRFRPLLAPGGGAGLRPGAAGRLDGLRLWHGRSHVLRAAIEGLACELARYLHFLREDDAPADRLIMCGAAAGGRVTPTIVADTTGLSVACCAETATSALGAAVLARGVVEPEADLAKLAHSMAPAVREIHPGTHSPLYGDLLAEYMANLPLAEEGAP